MNKIIKYMLGNKDWATGLFFFEGMYEDSFFYGTMKDYSLYDRNQIEHKKHYLKNQYIAENTQWIFKDTFDNLYGILHNFIVVSDNEGTFEYFCHNFQDIPIIKYKEIKSDNDYEYYKERMQSLYNIDIISALQTYQGFCAKNNLPLTTYKNVNEFDVFIAEEIKKMPEYI